jgi:hypothetical protein
VQGVGDGGNDGKDEEHVTRESRQRARTARMSLCMGGLPPSVPWPRFYGVDGSSVSPCSDSNCQRRRRTVLGHTGSFSCCLLP